MPSPSVPLKVLHVISGDLWAGAEVQALTLISMLKRNGVAVHAALLNEGQLAQRLRTSQIPVTVFDETRLSAVAILIALHRLMRQLRPDVVHTHRAKENVLGSIANRLAYNAPCLRTAHGAREHAPAGLRQTHKRFFMWLDRWCGSHLQQRVIAVSKDLAGRLATTFPDGHIVTIENGIDVQAIQAQIRSADYREDAPQATHVGVVGRLVPVKRVDLFLDTAVLLRRTHVDRVWRFHVFGNGPLLAQLQGQAKDLAIDDITRFHGNRDDIIGCIHDLDALLICSDHEGLPMAALEALAIGTPIVAHAIGGLVELLRGDPMSRLVHHHSPADYSSALWQVLSSITTARTGRVPPRFLASRNAARIQTLYCELVTPVMARFDP